MYIFFENILPRQFFKNRVFYFSLMSFVVENVSAST